MEEINLPSYEEINPGSTEMAKIKPPSYEEAIAADPSLHSPGINTAYTDDPVFQPTPTAPTMDMIESVETPIPIPAPLCDPDIRTALQNYRKKLRVLNGSKFIRNMTLTDIQNDCAFQCKLESLIEKRECAPRMTSYYGQIIDGPENGPTPDKWNVHVGMPLVFNDDEIKTEVPHTAYVRECPTCEGEKKIDCTPCWASGKVICSRCHGRGTEFLFCRICRGSGDENCSKCSGSGTIECTHCSGYGKVKYYMQLTATWRTHVDELVSNSYGLPEELVLKASGKEIFAKQARQVEPLNTAHPALNEASAVLIKKHASSVRNERIVAQRLSLRAVPITRATYIYRKKKGEVYVYGSEKKVYVENYSERFRRCTVS